MLDILSSLTELERLFLMGAAGAVMCLPLKDIITVDFYDICDVFLSLMGASVLFHLWDMPAPSISETGWLVALLAIPTIIIKVFIVVPFQKKGETSSLLSFDNYPGMTAEVTTPIKPDGIGEVIVRSPFGGNIHMARIHKVDTQTAKIPAGVTVRIVRVEDAILYVEQL